MTEKPSQNKQILSKLDELSEDVNVVKTDLSSIKKQIEMQPKIDQERFNNHNTRITNLENNQRWVILAILGTVINAVMQIILH